MEAASMVWYWGIEMTAVWNMIGILKGMRGFSVKHQTIQPFQEICDSLHKAYTNLCLVQNKQELKFRQLEKYQ